MAKYYFEDETFKNENYSEKKLPTGEYDHCVFQNIVFNGADLVNITFQNCSFENCDLSLAKIKDTAFREVKFTHCKMIGLRFDEVKPSQLALSFQDCILNFSYFEGLKMQKTIFESSKLEEVAFLNMDLTSATFNHCDLLRALFEHCNLHKVDFRTAYHLSIDPEKNKMKQAQFSATNVLGLLDKYQIVVAH